MMTEEIRAENEKKGFNLKVTIYIRIFPIVFPHHLESEKIQNISLKEDFSQSQKHLSGNENHAKTIYNTPL